MQKSRFFIGICPPHRLECRIHRIKEDIRQKYGLKEAFRSMAHITLQMPFLLSTKKVDLLLSALQTNLKNKTSFLSNLNGFGSFEPRVIYIEVLDNSELHSLQKEVEKIMKSFQVFGSTHKNNGFKPHITIASRDLKKHTFYDILEEMESQAFEDSFLVDHLTLFKHNGSIWEVYKEVRFGQI